MEIDLPQAISTLLSEGGIEICALQTFVTALLELLSISVVYAFMFIGLEQRRGETQPIIANHH